MLKNLLFIFAVFAVSMSLNAQEPSSIQFSNQGSILGYSYDFSNNPNLFPMTKLFIDGQGKIKEIRLNIKGSTLRIDAQGKPFSTIQGPFKVEWNDDNQIERIKEGYETVYRFDYDFDGNLEKVKDGSYNVCFALRYDFDNCLEKIDYGNYDFYAIFSYGENNRLESIKNGDYDYIWKLYYGSNSKLEEIKDDDYEVRAELSYNNGQLRNVSKYNTTTLFKLPGNYADNNLGYGNDNCQNPNNEMVVFFSDIYFKGSTLVYTLGNYPYLPHGWNDRISSVIIPHNVRVVLYENSNFSGESIVVNSNWTAIDWSDNWNDRASSIRIMYQ